MCEGLYNWLTTTLSRANNFVSEHETMTSEFCCVVVCVVYFRMRLETHRSETVLHLCLKITTNAPLVSKLHCAKPLLLYLHLEL